MTCRTAGNSGSTNVQKSSLPGAITMSQAEHYFLKEQAFTQSQRFTFGNAETKWFLLDPTNYTPGPTQDVGRVIFKLPGFVANAGPIEIDFYTDPTVAPAVATPLTLPSFNRVGDSSIAAQFELSSLNVAPGNLGTHLSQLLVPSNATGIGQQTGSTTVEELPFSFDAAVPVLLAVKNLAAAALVVIRHDWFEI